MPSCCSGDEAVVLGCLLLGCATSPAPVPATASLPEALECTYTWGGETKRVRVEPAPDPYRVPAFVVRDDFLLKVVYTQEPPDLASVRVYTYLPTEPTPLPLSEAKFRPPYARQGEFGFTGQLSAYDPRGHELQYFCAWVTR
jgi:hypothetical protein